MTTATLTLADFILARVAEDEAAAERGSRHNAPGTFANDNYGCLLVDPARVLAQCAAYRRIVELHQSWPVLVQSPPEFEGGLVGDPESVTLRMSQRMAWLTEQEYRNRFGDEPPTGPILAPLASIWADHPEFRPEWAL